MLTKITNFLSSKKFLIIATFLGLYLFSAGASWAIFSYFGGGSQISLLSGLGESRSRINLDLPRTETCPLNGGMFTKIESDIWEARRPIAIIVENHADARPQSGLSKADIVYEAVAEGGITRFLGIYYCGAAAEDVRPSPVRSARVYFIDWAAEYVNPIFMHVGGANDFAGFGDTVKLAQALELLETLGWRYPGGNDFDTTYDSGFPIFWRDYERLSKQVATEHTMVASLDAAYEEAEDRGFNAEDPDGDMWDEDFIKWKFADDSPSSDPSATEISFEFWSNKSDYDVIWKYDSESNSYLRENDGSKHVDHETGEQIAAKNVVILFVKEKGPVDINKHILYTTTGEGEALIFQNGEVIEVTWEKDTRTDRTKFFDEDGKEISFVRGPIWIEAVPSGNTIDY
jgi:hypothetical protein